MGGGAYGSGATDPRCGLPIEGLAEHPSRQLCTSCNALWKLEQKRRVAAAAATLTTFGLAPSPENVVAITKVFVPVKARKASAKERATSAPRRVVINAQPGSMLSMLVSHDPDEGSDPE